jgi:hypothetical protein
MAAVFAVALGYGVALPMLPFLLERLLADPGRFSVSWHVGIMASVYAFAMFLRVSDRPSMNDPETRKQTGKMRKQMDRMLRAQP